MIYEPLPVGDTSFALLVELLALASRVVLPNPVLYAQFSIFLTDFPLYTFDMHFS
jgi:hypothetical protein